MSYHRHVINDPRQLLDEEKSFHLSYDRREIVSELKPYAKILVLNGIFRITPFTQLFKDFGFNSNEIGKIIKFIASRNTKDILPVDRVFEKANFSEKNLMFTSLALIINDNLAQLLSEYLAIYYPYFKRKDDLIKNYVKLNKEIIDRAAKYAQTINTSQLSNQQIKTEHQNTSINNISRKPCKLPGIESFGIFV